MSASTMDLYPLKGSLVSQTLVSGAQVLADATSVMVAMPHRVGEQVDVEAVDRLRVAMAGGPGGSDPAHT